jgi:cobalt/nickel transport system ATP-binding protein
VDLVPLFATKICILNKGRIILEGTPEEVFSQADTIRSLDLRLPRITHLFEILRKNNQVNAGEHIPMTIGEARREIMDLLESKGSKTETKDEE